uniref:Uncharacterized protein n=1 Tax=Chromera velia CCMP2878 TaxID=1169474 RepID=A0A0G4HN46_9ALVE|eukprot:Cvel_7582.t1-p1 / transcript=Cvel_7582.t1 / gene=Cvel_7582 / organism=Chromera_velia_CCMP2878 / gene_product=hypothetical protein / transcript_product=hypothetical protein / location=Cvel_scaffold399:48420-49150(+) / protein_length=75 / sequence_SO=supercontig / SO=protein_coding / is_pseudo=false
MCNKLGRKLDEQQGAYEFFILIREALEEENPELSKNPLWEEFFRGSLIERLVKKKEGGTEDVESGGEQPFEDIKV